MTSADETRTRPPLTRRELRNPANRTPAPAPAAAARPRVSRRRRVLNVFAAVAACGFLAAYLVPTTAALAEAEPTSQFEDATRDAQAFLSAADTTRAEVDAPAVGSYEIYVTPKPEPEPEPAPILTSTSTEGSDGATTFATPFYTGGGAPADWMAAAGIAEGDWGFVDYIVSKESGWNPNATNASSGACGLVQALPCSKVPGNGYDPVDNLRWGNGYAVGRYGSWANAYAFWTANHWW